MNCRLLFILVRVWFKVLNIVVLDGSFGMVEVEGIRSFIGLDFEYSVK